MNKREKLHPAIPADSQISIKLGQTYGLPNFSSLAPTLPSNLYPEEDSFANSEAPCLLCPSADSSRIATPDINGKRPLARDA